MKNSVAEYVSSLKKSSKFGPQVVFHKTIPEKEARFDAFPKLHHELLESLSEAGIERLYTHQSCAVEQVRQENNIIVATPTSSGKSAIYNIPLFNTLLTQKNAHALYLFPLKALAQDQLKTLDKLWSLLQKKEGGHHLR